MKKRLSISIWTENALFQTKNCVAALLMMTSIVFGSLLKKVWPPLSIKLVNNESFYKCWWAARGPRAVVCPPLP